MPVAETARLVASLELKDNFTATAKRISSSVGGLETKVGRMGTAMAKSRAFAVGLGVGLEQLAAKGLGDAIGAIENGINQAELLQRANAQTAAALKSTGDASGQTVDSIRALSQAEEDLTTVDDKIVQSGANVLLRYTAIGKTVFPEATRAATDMAIALAKGDTATADVAGAAAILGKALQDPTKGLGALRKAGVVLTQGEQDQIKAVQKAGDTIGAQELLLKALEVRYGEAGKAAGQGFPADVQRFRDSVDDAERSLAEGLLPALQSTATWLTTKLRDPRTIQFLHELGAGIGDALQAGLNFAQTIPWDSIGNALRIGADAAKAIVGAFTSLPPWLQTAVITGWGLNKLTGGAITDLIGTLGSGLIKGVLGMNAGVVNINAGVVNGAGGVAGAAGAAGGSSRLAKGLFGAAAIADVLGVIAAQQAVSGESSNQAAGIHQTLKAELVNSPTTNDLKTALAAIDTGIAEIQSNPLNVLVQGSALDELKAMRAETVAKIEALDATAVRTGKVADDNAALQTRGLASVRASMDADRTGTIAAAEKARAATASGLAAVRSGVDSDKASTVSAINAMRSSQSSALAAVRSSIDSDKAASVAAADAAAAAARGTTQAVKDQDLSVKISLTPHITVPVSVSLSGIARAITTRSRIGSTTSVVLPGTP